jgi:hypothetical protein
MGSFRRPRLRRPNRRGRRPAEAGHGRPVASAPRPVADRGPGGRCSAASTVLELHSGLGVEVGAPAGPAGGFAPSEDNLKNKDFLCVMKESRPDGAEAITGTTDFERHRIDQRVAGSSRTQISWSRKCPRPLKAASARARRFRAGAPVYPSAGSDRATVRAWWALKALRAADWIAAAAKSFAERGSAWRSAPHSHAVGPEHDDGPAAVAHRR